ncbi:acyl-CoA dehydrogenase NM domain-like protein [Mytilinidion resinicola]|uniref:DASH complex subunit SPC34 n=1 Tax=Mytilinidion resinicola TaxID=574789 RepID=A0A6A6YIW4_9PEZI|nr:acyl-CoA dehydrogenase NM domain-like protein [Mytilinidion resinicola]KAF2807895.1 acyl-CoA dehydrogenase NM domain-like protein [Mytilinidion resinicola]
MTLLDAHLEQISFCAASIAELPSSRRNTIFNPNGGSTSITGGGANAVRAPRRNTAVAAVLGTELVERIRRGGGGGAGTGLGYRTFDGTNRNDVDVEVLLEGAEKLCGVYPIPGAREKIAALRQRHRRLEASIESYEIRVAEQNAQLSRMNRPRDFDDEPEEEEPELEAPPGIVVTEEDLRREEEEIRELERKKQGLEDRTALRNGARAFAQNVLAGAPSVYSQLPDQAARFRSTRPIYRKAVEAGFIAGQIPAPLGGTAGSLINAAILVEELYAVEPSASLTILGTGLGLTPLLLGGSQEQHARLLKPFLSGEGEPLASLVHSEPGGTANWLEQGSPGLQTTARKEGNEWVINGEKDPNSDPATSILILVVTSAEIANNKPAAFVVLGDPELAGHKAASGPHSRFTEFRVPEKNLLAPPGSGAELVEKTFGSSAALVGAMAIGIMRAAFDAALAFAKSDTRGGTAPILYRQSVADLLIDIKMRVEAGRALTWKALSCLEKGPGGFEARLEIALEAKIWCSDQAVKCVMDAMKTVGMTAYASDQPFSRLLEDAACLPLFDGGNVGIRRRQIEKIFQRDDYSPWAATYE